MESHPGWLGNLPSDTPFGSSKLLRDADPLLWQDDPSGCAPLLWHVFKEQSLSPSTRWLTFRLSCGAALARLASTKTTFAASERLNRTAIAPSTVSRLLSSPKPTEKT